MNAKPAADLLVRAARVRTMDPAAGPVTTLAIRGGKIAATASGPGEERDLLDAWNGPDTVMLDDAGLVVLPAFVDTHNHLMLAAQQHPRRAGLPGRRYQPDCRADQGASRADPAGPVDPHRRRLA